MSLDPLQAARLAAHRFGFGPRGGVVSPLDSDPSAALLAELDRHPNAEISAPNLVSSGQAIRTLAEYVVARRNRQLEAAAAKDMVAGKAAEPSGSGVQNSSMAAPDIEARPLQIYRREVQAHFAAAIDADIGFVERLVWFWSNHFCVSSNKNSKVHVAAGAFEREAIRAHVLGRFEDMLVAVETHPAMLMFLDNERSIGPNSLVGLRRNKGINENLAREILELHTLGVRTVYTQADVTNFSKVLTGWTVVLPAHKSARGGEFEFNPRFHEPGPQTVIGKSYPDYGFEQGRAVLRDLADHPATAHHIATKLAIHFVDDTPPPSLVERLTKRFLDTGGDLKEVSRTLVTSPESWEARRVKLKRPGEWFVGALRACGQHRINPALPILAENNLGEPIWRPPSPKGFSDYNAGWLDGLAQRLQVANLFGQKFEPAVEPGVLLDRVLGPLASKETRDTIAQASDRAQAFTLLAMAPEFLWR